MKTAHARESSIAFGAIAIVLAACSPSPSFDDGSGGDWTGSGSTDLGSGAASGNGGDAATPTSGPGGDGDGDGGAPATSSSSSIGSTSVSAVSTGTGAECTVDADCYDAVPCTDDTCGPLGTCERVAVTPGLEGNPGEGSCPSGVCQIDGSCGLQVYSHPFGDPSGTWSRQALSELWGAGANHPPSTGIAEVEYLRSFEGLVVFTADGTLYRRNPDGTWAPALPAGEVFAGLPEQAVRCSYSIQFDEKSPTTQLTLTALEGGLQSAYIYTVEDFGVAPEPAAGNPYPVTNEDGQGSPPPDSEPCRWSFPEQTAFTGTASWVVIWQGQGMNTYLLDGGNFIWTNFGEESGSPVWDAVGEGPAQGTTVAAWLEDGVVYLIAP